jgi:murein DD-endopeptidase MepM/ murein hydrolase activator NlpD
VHRRPAGVAVLVALALTLLGSPGAAARPGPAWIRPVPGAVVRSFRAPLTPYGPGHRGVDFAAAPGTPVEAAGPGTVVFAGRIGPSSHVVVLHRPSGWRTGYSFLAAVAVHKGERVRGGDVVGTSGGLGDGHGGAVLHFSLRIGEDYVDPMMLFRPLDLGAVVHLAPMPSGAGPGRSRPPAAGYFGERWRMREHAFEHWRWF